MNISKNSILLLLGLMLSTVACPAPVEADSKTVSCRVYSFEDISSARHQRARIFVATPADNPGQAVALGYAVALEAVENNRLAFVTVLVTRQMDGLDRDIHSSGTALATVSFNPGGTPVIDTRLQGQMVERPVTERGDLSVLLTPKRDLFTAEVMSHWLDAKDAGVRFSCLKN